MATWRRKCLWNCHQGFKKGMKERSAGSRRPYMGSSSPLGFGLGVSKAMKTIGYGQRGDHTLFIKHSK